MSPCYRAHVDHGDGSKTAKNHKSTINHTNIAWMSMLVWLIVSFMILAVFDFLTVYKLQFFTYIFAVSLPDLSRLSCHSVQRMFFWKSTQNIKRINQSKCVTTGADFRKWMVKTVKLRQRAKVRVRRSNVAEIRRFFAVLNSVKIGQTAAILDFWHLKF